ncbi:hypothetical protein [Tortoise microvirus 80]|nr:hypothetical protein [Tortoise microvirus 80]
MLFLPILSLSIYLIRRFLMTSKDFIPSSMFGTDDYVNINASIIVDKRLSHVVNSLVSRGKEVFPSLPVSSNPLLANYEYFNAVCSLALYYYFDMLGVLSPSEIAPSTPDVDDDSKYQEEFPFENY